MKLTLPSIWKRFYPFRWISWSMSSHVAAKKKSPVYVDIGIMAATALLLPMLTVVTTPLLVLLCRSSHCFWHCWCLPSSSSPYCGGEEWCLEVVDKVGGICTHNYIYDYTYMFCTAGNHNYIQDYNNYNSHHGVLRRRRPILMRSRRSPPRTRRIGSWHSSQSYTHPDVPVRAYGGHHEGYDPLMPPSCT